MEQKLKNLRIFNIVMGIFHFAQAVAVYLISDPQRGIVPISV